MDVDQHHALSTGLYVRSESKESTWQRAGSWLLAPSGLWFLAKKMWASGKSEHT
jgi:hypothetical protein